MTSTINSNQTRPCREAPAGHSPGKHPGKPSSARDHLGNDYPSENAMCKAYGLSQSTYKHRIGTGMDIETALTAPLGPCRRPKPSTDHTGREFRSVSAMCEAWGVAPDLYCQRRKRGMSVEEALTRPTDRQGLPPRNAKPSTDHTGREFLSASAMCEAWGVAPDIYRRRRKRGMSVEEALTGPTGRYGLPPRNAKPSTDHTGAEFSSVRAMLAAWRVTPDAYYRRVRLGMSIEEALTGKSCRGRPARRA